MTEVGNDFGYIAGENLNQYCAVLVHTDGTIHKAGTAASNALGICQDNATQGRPTAIRESGHSKACILTGCNPGDPLQVGDSSGRLTTGITGTNPIIAVALTGCSETDQIAEVVLARLSLS